jgi:hypothetical protein
VNKKANLPIEGKAIRFAPGIGQEPATSFWRVWSEGSEIYALSRPSGRVAKVSVHASGQIHCRFGDNKQNLMPLSQLGYGPWFHAFEMRFLLTEASKAPSGQRKSLKNKLAYVVPVPEGHVLHVNLIIGTLGMTLDSPLPIEFSGSQAFWRTRLRDGRTAILVGRILALSDENQSLVNYYRDLMLKTTVRVSNSKDAAGELWHLHWSPAGSNVLLVVPMLHEVFRYE